jgi:hypothetical protein
MKAHEGGGDIVGIERGATFHLTVHGHSTYPDPGPGKILGQREGSHAQRRLARAQTRQPRVRVQCRAAACEQQRTVP